LLLRLRESFNSRGIRRLSLRAPNLSLGLAGRRRTTLRGNLGVILEGELLGNAYMGKAGHLTTSSAAALKANWEVICVQFARVLSPDGRIIFSGTMMLSPG
jgi:hypothetical protein